MSAAHARLSASSAHRWLSCPGSVQAGSGAPSAYAAQGTFAHGIAAKCLKQDLDPGDFLLKREVVDGYPVECDQEMVDVIQQYLDVIVEDKIAGDKGYTEVSLLESLQKVDPDLGGTADYVRYRTSDKSLNVFDFKYGSGIYVEADSNEQLMIYALGSMLRINKPIVEVTVTIVQPRFEGAAPVRSWKFPAFQLLEFVADIKEAAARTRQHNPVLVAGDYCKFCPAARTCPELERQQHALIATDFTGVVNYVALAEALTSIPLVKERIKAIEEFAYTEAQRGVDIPGFKLVDKRPVRKWKNEGDVVEWAQSQALDPYAPREVLSVAQLEKKLGETALKGKKKEAGAVLVPFYEKVSSGTALVPVSDDRPPAKLVTATDFAVIDGTVDKT